MFMKRINQNHESRCSEHFIHQLFPGYSVVLNQASHKTLANRLYKTVYLESNSVNPENNLSTISRVLFPEVEWFKHSSSLNFLKQWFLLQENPIRIWSVGCRLGQEPYSISCCFSEIEHAVEKQVASTLEIIGTDVSSQGIERAERGIYTKEELRRGVSWLRKRRFFSKVEGTPYYQVNQKERERVSFLPQNLLKGFHGLGDFDMVFCSDVMPYFSKNLRYALLCRLVDRLKPNGYLFLGNTKVDLKMAPFLKDVSTQSGFFYQKISLHHVGIPFAPH